MSTITSQKPHLVSSYLNAIKDQSLGFSFGTPLRCDEKSLAVVLPILRQTSINRQYVTFPETEKVLVFDSGNIEIMDAENQGDQNVFIRSGTIFKGPTQARALQRSAVVFPGKKQSLKVRCIHRSHGINTGAKTTYGGLTPHDFDACAYDDGFKPKDQHAYWQAAEQSSLDYCSMAGNDIRMQSTSPASDFETCFANTTGSSLFVGARSGGKVNSPLSTLDNLSLHMDSFAQNFDDVLSKVKLVENQTGLALINQNGVEIIETFDHPDSWKALHESAVKRLGSNIVDKDQDGVFKYCPDAAQRQVCGVLALDWELTNIFRHRPSNGEPQVEITGLSCGQYVGELVEINGSMAHLTILKKAQ